MKFPSQEPIKVIIRNISNPVSMPPKQPGTPDQSKQMIVVEEPSQKEGGKPNVFHLELWNNFVEKLQLQRNYKKGDAVTIEFWLNGKERQGPGGSKAEYSLTLKSIAPAE